LALPTLASNLSSFSLSVVISLSRHWLQSSKTAKRTIWPRTSSFMSVFQVGIFKSIIIRLFIIQNHVEIEHGYFHYFINRSPIFLFCKFLPKNIVLIVCKMFYNSNCPETCFKTYIYQKSIRKRSVSCLELEFSDMFNSRKVIYNKI